MARDTPLMRILVQLQGEPAPRILTMDPGLSQAARADLLATLEATRRGDPVHYQYALSATHGATLLRFGNSRLDDARPPQRVQVAPPTMRPKRLRRITAWITSWSLFAR